MDATCHARNAAARTRLDALVGRLTAADLDEPLGGGWTVKAALGHLAFWDRYAAAAVEQWRANGYTWSGGDDPYINAAGLSDWLAATPEHALREVLRAAEVADSAAARIDDALWAAIIAGSESWACERGVHRLEHIEQIEQALAQRPANGL